MENQDLVKIIVSFVTAGIWISAATALAERLGSRVGGLIANLPSNIVVSLVFVALIHDGSFAAEATHAVPVGMLIDTVFLFIFILAVRRGMAFAVIISLISWFGLAVIAAELVYSNWVVNTTLYIVITILLFIVLGKLIKIPDAARSIKKYSLNQLLIRALFAGSVVAATIILSTFAGTYWTGLFTTFPAVLLSTMVILAYNQSVAFAQATGKILILSSSNIVVYGIGVYFTYPTLGIIRGTVISFVAAFVWVWLLSPVMKRLR
ncbi:MAG: hypothetical protein CVT49_13720 [candidate division Zixibacteria bacterium HGW-Zixibacteria-1]|nr:MAG: hypothetical protein CVT49_13720 [candidate division Zixibacteria bacterium HGW-Zixibacteria-1]